MAGCHSLRWRLGASPGDPQKLVVASSANVSPPARRLTDEVDYFRIAEYTGVGQTIRPRAAYDLVRYMLKLCGWEICDEGSGAA
jgi:hypothetical protein